ncbi:MAG: sulfotransferase, partial [Pseudomonadota bacterium]
MEKGGAEALETGSQAAEQTCLLVLGMHRSGTSALTRILHFAGAKLPSRLLGAGTGNEAGHWEPEALVEYHDQLLEQLGSAWHDWSQLDVKKLSSNRRDEILSEIAKIIAEDYGDASLMVVKEPRICRFVPLFVAALHAAKITSVPILMLRNPLEVINSLVDRNGMARTAAALLWLRHVLDAEAATREANRALLSFDALMVDWREEFQRILDQTGVQLPHDAG